jgi:hypothetical protein
MAETKKQSIGCAHTNRVPMALVLAQLTQAAGLPIASLWEMTATEWMFAVAQRLGKVST